MLELYYKFYHRILDNYFLILIKVHHIGIFYKINEYKEQIKEKIEVTKINDDSKGAAFYDIKNLKRENLSSIAILELEKLGYNLK